MRSSMMPALYRDFSPHLFFYTVFHILKLSNIPSFRAIRALIASQSSLKNKLVHATVYFLTFLLLFVSHFTQVLECFDM